MARRKNEVSFDEIRAAFPKLSIFVSAGANESVTVELYGPSEDGRSKTVTEATLQACLDRIMAEAQPPAAPKPPRRRPAPVVAPEPPADDAGGFFD